MDFNAYQKMAMTTDVYHKNDGPVILTEVGFLYKVIGLAGESGEVSEKIKKVIRNKNGILDETDKIEIVKEMGDVLWYLATMAEYMGVAFDEVAKANIAKLSDRKSRGVLKSKGDNR